MSRRQVLSALAAVAWCTNRPMPTEPCIWSMGVYGFEIIHVCNHVHVASVDHAMVSRMSGCLRTRVPLQALPNQRRNPLFTGTQRQCIARCVK